MAALIAYATKHGFTKNCAQELQKRLQGGADLWDLKSGRPDLSKYDRVILGSAVYIGQARKEMKEFIAAEKDELAKKQLGLFLCCTREGAEAKNQMDFAYPVELRNAAKAQGFLGGAYDFGKMGFFEKMIVKKVAGVKESTTIWQKDALEKFVQDMA